MSAAKEIFSTVVDTIRLLSYILFMINSCGMIPATQSQFTIEYIKSSISVVVVTIPAVFLSWKLREFRKLTYKSKTEVVNFICFLHFLVCVGTTIVSIKALLWLYLFEITFNNYLDITIGVMWHVPIVSYMIFNTISRVISFILYEDRYKESKIITYSRAILCIICIISLLTSIVCYCLVEVSLPHQIPVHGLIWFQMGLHFIFWICLQSWPVAENDESKRTFLVGVHRITTFSYYCIHYTLIAQPFIIAFFIPFDPLDYEKKHKIGTTFIIMTFIYFFSMAEESFILKRLPFNSDRTLQFLGIEDITTRFSGETFPQNEFEHITITVRPKAGQRSEKDRIELVICNDEDLNKVINGLEPLEREFQREI